MSAEFPTCPSEPVAPRWSSQVSAIPGALGATAVTRLKASIDSALSGIGKSRMRSRDTTLNAMSWVCLYFLEGWPR
jgi:hypothetical protein